MTDALQKQFEAAATEVKSLGRRPDNEDMLRLYALYKQGSTGDVSGERPGGFALVERAKYDAWARLKGTEPKRAMESYIQLVERLKKAYG